MSRAYYNEHDPYAAEWLRNLIAAGHLPEGDVDERDIRDIAPYELEPYTQCHFFAGIGVWAYALRRAGWADDRPVWTGSCPCQPFSAAGRRAGTSDERHLWPHWHWLIQQRRPPIVFGEQVASKDGLGWLDLVSADMERTGYAFAATDLCAAGITLGWEGSQAGQWLQRAIHHCTDPVIRRMLGDFADWAGVNLGEGGNHIRQRLYFAGVADAAGEGPFSSALGGVCAKEEGAGAWDGEAQRCGDNGRLADTIDPRSQGGISGGQAPQRKSLDGHSGRNGATGGLGNADGGNARAEGQQRGGQHGCRTQDAGDGMGTGGTIGSGQTAASTVERTDQDHGRRHHPDWLLCRDGFWRPVEPCSFPLAHGVAGRMGRLRAYGNALDAETAENFIIAAMGSMGFGLC